MNVAQGRSQTNEDLMVDYMARKHRVEESIRRYLEGLARRKRGDRRKSIRLFEPILEMQKRALRKAKA